MIQTVRCLLYFVVILVAFNSNAKVFRNAYISFEMPDTWKCVLEQTEWVCRSDPEKFSKEAKEAIIILTAKEVGPTDSIQLYEQHLNSPIQTNTKGSLGQSKIQYKSKQVTINDQVWIDGLHFGSEVNSYYTRYFATVKDRIAILVTFSAHQLYYAKYSQDFFKAIMSMKVIAAKNLLTRPDVGPINPRDGNLLGQSGRGMPADITATEAPPTENTSSPFTTYLALASILGAVGVYFFIKSKKK